MSNAILYRMSAGIPGTPNRLEQCTIELQMYDTNTPPTVFGVPIKYVSGLVQPIAAADVIATVNQGLLVRPYPTQAAVSEALGAATPNSTQIADVMKRGYLLVKVNASVPAAVPSKGSIVYCRKTDHGAGEYPIGGIESDADAGKCEAIPCCFFTGAMDAAGNCEVSYNL